jgi:hypothetical protein
MATPSKTKITQIQGDDYDDLKAHIIKYWTSPAAYTAFKLPDMTAKPADPVDSKPFPIGTLVRPAGGPKCQVKGYWWDPEGKRHWAVLKLMEGKLQQNSKLSPPLPGFATWLMWNPEGLVPVAPTSKPVVVANKATAEAYNKLVAADDLPDDVEEDDDIF